MGVWMSEQNGLVFHNEEEKGNEPLKYFYQILPMDIVLLE